MTTWLTRWKMMGFFSSVGGSDKTGPKLLKGWRLRLEQFQSSWLHSLHRWLGDFNPNIFSPTSCFLLRFTKRNKLMILCGVSWFHSHLKKDSISCQSHLVWKTTLLKGNIFNDFESNVSYYDGVSKPGLQVFLLSTGAKSCRVRTWGRLDKATHHQQWVG